MYSRLGFDRPFSQFVALGLSQKEASARIEVDQGTLARWERGEREPTGGYAVRASHFVAAIEAKRRRFHEVLNQV